MVSPSSPSKPEELTRGLARWAEHLDLGSDPRPFSRKGFLAGDDNLRAGALRDAITDPAARAVLIARGGHGALRVLESHGEALRKALTAHPKPVVGFSDVTALHALWTLCDLRSLHAPMVAAVGRGADPDETRAALYGETPSPWRDLVPIVPGDAEGIARGGNLAVLCALLGTPWALPLEGAVLFLEDIGEAPYRLDRMLTSLRLSGALRGVRAVVCGEFTGCAPNADGVTVDDVLRDRLGDLGVPVLTRAPFGHGELHRPWVQGARVRLTREGAVVHTEGLWAVTDAPRGA